MVTGTLSLQTSSLCICCVFDYCGCWIDSVVDFSISSPRSFLHVQLFPYCCCSRCMSSLRPSSARSPGSRPPQPARHGPDASAIPLEDSPGDAFSALEMLPPGRLGRLCSSPSASRSIGAAHSQASVTLALPVPNALAVLGWAGGAIPAPSPSACTSQHDRTGIRSAEPQRVPPRSLQVPSSLPFLSIPAWL